MIGSLVFTSAVAGMWIGYLIDHAKARDLPGALRCLFWVAFCGVGAFLAWRGLPVCP